MPSSALTGFHVTGTLEAAAAVSLLFVLLELGAWRWRRDLQANRTNAPSLLWGESPDGAAPSQVRLSSSTLGDPPDQRRRGGNLRIETTDIDEGRRVVEGVLGVTAKKWRLRSSATNGVNAVVLVYECQLRRAYWSDVVRARVLSEGQPFVQAVEWQSSNRLPSKAS